MKAARSRIAALEARAELREEAEWAYTTEPAYLHLTDDERASIDAAFERFQAAFTGSLQDALSTLSDADLETLERFCLACGRVDAEGAR